MTREDRYLRRSFKTNVGYWWQLRTEFDGYTKQIDNSFIDIPKGNAYVTEDGECFDHWHVVNDYIGVVFTI